MQSFQEAVNAERAAALRVRGLHELPQLVLVQLDAAGGHGPPQLLRAQAPVTIRVRLEERASVVRLSVNTSAHLKTLKFATVFLKFYDPTVLLLLRLRTRRP